MRKLLYILILFSLNACYSVTSSSDDLTSNNHEAEYLNCTDEEECTADSNTGECQTLPMEIGKRHMDLPFEGVCLCTEPGSVQ